MKNNHFEYLLISFILCFGIMTKAYANLDVTVVNGYLKASIPGSDVTAAYMTIKNASNSKVTLKKVTSGLSDRIEIHEHSMSDGMMRMRKVEDVVIEAKSEMLLQPSGFHLMIFSLTQQITEQDVAAFTLHFSNDVKINIQLPVYRHNRVQ